MRSLSPTTEGARLFGRDVEDIIADYTGRRSDTPRGRLEIDLLRAHATDPESGEAAEDVEDTTGCGKVGETGPSDGGVPYQWVMFAEPTAAGFEFLGAYIVEAASFEEAVFIIDARGQSPGGRADGVALPHGLNIDPDFRNRILSYRDAQTVRRLLDAAFN